MWFLSNYVQRGATYRRIFITFYEFLLHFSLRKSWMTSFFKIKFPKSTFLNFCLITFGTVTLLNCSIQRILLINFIWNIVKLLVKLISNYDVFLSPTRFSFFNEKLSFASYPRKYQYQWKCAISPKLRAHILQIAIIGIMQNGILWLDGHQNFC